MPKANNTKINTRSASVAPRSIGSVHMLINALDYKKTQNPLTCTIDATNIQELVAACNISDVDVMLNEECTKGNVEARMRQVGSRCNPGDTFVFYYSGHGTNIKDLSGDEADGTDEAYCFVTPDGQITLESCMIDDDFAKIITSAIPDSCTVLVLSDCCHSGTICDFEKSCWMNRTAISISGCQDNQTSGDIGKGGIFTHSMLMAIDKAVKSGETAFTVEKLYNDTLDQDNTIFNSPQNITIQWVEPDSVPSGVAWPLVPPESYTAPLLKKKKQFGCMDVLAKIVDYICG